MRKFIAAIMVVALMLSLAGCASKEEKEAAKAVSAQIEKLTSVTLEDTAAVQAAQEAYVGLTDNAKKRVKNHDILETAWVELADLVTETIDNIGTVTLESEAAIGAAQDAYDSLPAESRALVKNYADLEDAAAELAVIKEAAFVTEMIDNIGTVTLDSEEIIEEAKTAYGALPEEGRELVKNYDKLEAANLEYIDIFFAEMNRMTDNVLEITDALNSREISTVLALIEETLPLAEKVASSKYYVVEEDPVGTLTGVRDLLIEACYPNTNILSLDSLIKIESVYNATADSNEGEKPNRDEDNGMDFYSYIYDTKSQMNNAFQAYTKYLDSHFEVVSKKNVPNQSQYSPVLGSMYTTTTAEYFYKDEQNHEFYVYLNYIDMGSYFGEVCTIYVFFDPEMGVLDAFAD